MKLSITTWGSCDEQDTEETKYSWGDAVCNGTDVILSTSKILRRSLRPLLYKKFVLLRKLVLLLL